MPEGITLELVLAAGLVLLIAVTFLVTRTRGRPPEAPTSKPTAPPPPPAEDIAEPAVEAPPEAPPPPPAPPAERPSLRDRLVRSRKFLAARISEALGGGVTDETWDDLEAALIGADLGAETAATVVGDLRTKARDRGAADPDALRALLAEDLVEMFDASAERTLAFGPEGPTVWLVVGVNGTGKTTTIGKLAADLRRRERSVALAAADTFRAAADEQLGIWGERAGASLVKHRPGADPGAVAFDAYAHARAKGIDVLIVDTAGRLHTKTPLMDELAKVRRVIEKEGRVDETLLVIDATAGQNGLVQAQKFAAAAGVTGIVLTKLDGTAKGGIAVVIERELGIPIKLIGVGEGIEDLEPFEPRAFVDALLS